MTSCGVVAQTTASPFPEFLSPKRESGTPGKRAVARLRVGSTRPLRSFRVELHRPESMTSPQDSVLEWFAVRTRSNREAVVEEALRGKGFDVWCPRFKPAPFRANSALRPVFPGYVLCRFDVRDRLPILTVPGVMNVVSNGRIPLPIDEREIESLRIVLRSMMPVSPHDYLSVGDRVRITEGPLAGAEGQIVQHEPELLVVSITLRQRSVSVAVQVEWLEKSRRAA